MEYKEYYREQLEKALEYQDFVAQKLYEIGLPVVFYCSRKYQAVYGETRSGVEVKYDDKMKQTKNLYIEYAEKADPGNKAFVPSGIDREDNSWLHVQGDYKRIYILSKNWLQQFKALDRFKHVENATSKGYLMPEEVARKYAIKVIEC